MLDIGIEGIDAFLRVEASTMLAENLCTVRPAEDKASAVRPF